LKDNSIPLFEIEGGARLSVTEANTTGRVRLVIHDTASRDYYGHDIILSCPLEQADDLARAVIAFNREMRFAKVSG
jgi:hypothetical protein